MARRDRDEELQELELENSELREGLLRLRDEIDDLVSDDDDLENEPAEED